MYLKGLDSNPNPKGTPMISVDNPKFQLGLTLITPGAQEALAETGESPWTFFARHVRGDWGDVCAEDAALNDEALKDGSRLLSVYTLGDKTTRIYLITEAEDDFGKREATTILLPEEY